MAAIECRYTMRPALMWRLLQRQGNWPPESDIELIGLCEIGMFGKVMHQPLFLGRGLGLGNPPGSDKTFKIDI